MTHTTSDDLREAGTFEHLSAQVLQAARRIAHADGATFVVRDGEYCFYVDEDVASPLWRGQRFPIETCISGWAMLNNDVAVIGDIYADERIPHEAYRPTFVRSLVSLPMGTEDSLGALGVYWAQVDHRPTDIELAALRELGYEAGRAIRRLGLDTAPWAPNFAYRDAINARAVGAPNPA